MFIDLFCERALTYKRLSSACFSLTSQMSNVVKFAKAKLSLKKKTFLDSTVAGNINTFLQGSSLRMIQFRQVSFPLKCFRLLNLNRTLTTNPNESEIC